MTPRRAFSLIELLVVIAVIAILAALLLPALSGAKKRAGQAQCINDLKQLGTGIVMYIDDNQDTFPGPASLHHGFQPTDWIYWRTNTALYPPVEKSPIVIAMANASRTLFRCPLDVSDVDRLFQSDSPDGPYLFSYSLTGYGVSGTANVGMSSVFNVSGSNVVSFPFKLSSVRNPSGKIMFAEEPGTFRENPDSGAVIDDGRWEPTDPDPLTTRHGGKADVTFTDGHVLAVTSKFGEDTNNSWPGL
jgi:prepilin-type N-terminal cleavage/methylation domain-containing protein/prepilin-type processing-associated H-X9-DG protein